jgi:peptidyl-prolyl cis-trans isomerase C
MAAASILALAACSRKSDTASPSVAAMIGGQPITQSLFEYYAREKAGVPADQLDAQRKQSLLHDLEQIKAAAIAEERKADPTTQAAIELQRLETLARAGATAAGVFAEPTDAELRAEYDRYTAAQPPQEWHVAHILVATEAQAQVLISRLQGGADFARLAATDSADDSRAKGGDLGWIVPGKFPVDFTNAVSTLRPGQFTQKPVHTIYGWHIIKLLESKPAAPPAYTEVKAQLATNLQQARYKKYLESAAAGVIVNRGT